MTASPEDDELMSGINVTPLVDVCLVLVIIFMVTAPMLSEPVLKVELPQAATREGEESDKITVTLARDGHLALDQKTYSSLDGLVGDLKDRMLMSDSRMIVIKADKDARHGLLTEVMAKAKDAGAESITIATERKR